MKELTFILLGLMSLYFAYYVFKTGKGHMPLIAFVAASVFATAIAVLGFERPSSLLQVGGILLLISLIFLWKKSRKKHHEN
ncbi:MAG: hypothetical protein ABJ205_07665 [Erythrobacter sp.]|uniref:hypothetical protein n=1 Tax=Erythrobacter sp. TaxID=1042 RepID=UPI0032675F54